MTTWHKLAHREIVEFGKSRPPTSGKKAGQIYEFADRLTQKRAESLPGLGPGNPDIRWWEFTNMTIFIRIDVRPFRVLHFCETRTAHQRRKCALEARTRC